MGVHLHRVNRLGFLLLSLAWMGFITLLLALVARAWGEFEAFFVLVALLVVGSLLVLQLSAGRRATVRAQRVTEGLCSECGYDLRARRERCPECGTEIPVRSGEAYIVPLRDEWPDKPLAPRTPEPHETRERIYTGPDGMEQDLLVQQLRARGIACFITRRKAGGPRLYQPEPWVNDVHVWSGDAAAARGAHRPDAG
jgi:hypothetical protein